VKTQEKILLVALILTVLTASLFPTKVDAFSNRKGKFQEEIDTAILKGFDYIAGQINEDGGVRWVDESSSVAATVRVIQALGAAGYPQDYISSESGKSPIDFLISAGWDWVNKTESETPGFDVARAGQLLTAVAAANKNPHDFGHESVDLIYEINGFYDRNTGVFGNSGPDNVLDQVWGMMGLSANNAYVPLEAADWLASVQAEDGSWNDGFGSLLDTTPLAIMALIGSNHYNVDSPGIQSGLSFIKENQKEDGGWQTEWDTATNPNTTGMILQALSSLGQFPAADNWQQPEGKPLTALIAVQQENGVFGGEFGNTFSTADAIIGLTGRNINSLGFLEGASDAFDYLFEMQGPDGGWGNVGQTLDVMLALNAAGWQPNTVSSEGITPMDFISENLISYIEAGPDAIGKSIIGITAAGMDPQNYNGIDLVSSLMETYDETTQAFGSPENTWHQAFGILGLYPSAMKIPQGPVETLLGMQKEDGGWEYSTGMGTSPDSTSLAVQALIASGYSGEDQEILNALEFLHKTQSDDGGWGNSSTTSFAIMALNALGETSDFWVSDSGKNPVSNLFFYQKVNGAFVYSWEFPDDSIMSTASSLLAIFGGDYLLQSNELPDKNLAAIVIDPGNGEIQTACVDFEEDSISGFELLERSGFSYNTDQDGFLNSILEISNHEGETNYWSYWKWDGRGWQFQNIGASNTVVAAGTIEAWHFTSWEQYPSLPPEYTPDINDICGEEILAEYSQNPFLGYNNLHPFALQEQVEVEGPSETTPQETTDEPNVDSTKIIDQVEEQEETIQSLPSAEEDQKDKQEQPGSPIAFYLLAGAGVILLIFLSILYLRRQK